MQELNIPDEILSFIFSYFSSGFLLNEISVVSSRWQRCVNSPLVWSQKTVGLSHNLTNVQDAIRFMTTAGITKFALFDSRWIDQLMPSMHDKMTHLGIFTWEDNLSNHVMWQPRTFSNLTHLQLMPDDRSIAENWMSFMPNLTQLSGWAGREGLESNSFKKRLLECKKIQKLEIYDLIDSEYLLKLFENLPLQRLLVLTRHVNQTIWRQISELPNVCERLTSLHITHDEEEAPVSSQVPIVKIRPFNFTSLTLKGSGNNFLLFASQQTLQVLDISLDENADFSALNLPNILELYSVCEVSLNTVINLLRCCGTKLKQMAIVLHSLKAFELPTVQLNFPYLKTLELSGVPQSFAEILMGCGSIENLILKEISIDQDSCTGIELTTLTSLKSFTGPISQFNRLPATTLSSIQSLKFIDHSHEYDTDTTAMNWFSKMLSLPQLTYVSGITASLSCEPLVIPLTESSRLTTIEMRIASNFATTISVLLKIPSLTNLNLHSISKQEISMLISLIPENSALERLTLETEANLEHDSNIEECNYLSRSLSCVRFITDTNIEDILLLSVCLLTEAQKIITSISTESIVVESQLRKLVPSMVLRIAGVSSDKRKRIEDNLVNSKDRYKLLSYLTRNVADHSLQIR